MIKNSSPLRRGLLLALIAFVFLSPFGLFDGFYYQSQSDTVFPTYLLGFYNNGTDLFPLAFGCFTLLSKALNYGYHTLGIVHVYDLFQLFAVVLCSFYWALIAYDSIKGSLKAKAAYITLIIILLFGFVSTLEFTKTSLILGVTGLHLWFNKNSIIPLTIGILLFLLALFVRAEGGTLALAVYLGYLLASKKWRILEPTIRYRSFFVFLLVLGIGILLNLETSPSNTYYLNNRPYENALADFNMSSSALSRLSTKDSIKVYTASKFFFADTSKLNPSYFASIDGIKGIDKKPVSLIKHFLSFDWFKNYRNSLMKFTETWSLFALVLGVSLLSYLKRAWFFTLIALAQTTVIIILSLALKAEFHVITSYISLTLILTLIAAVNKKTKESPLQIPVLLFTLFAAFAYLGFSLNLTKTYANKHLYYEAVLKDIQKASDSKTIMLNVSVWDEFHYKLFSPYQPSNHQEIFVLDGGILHLGEEHERILIERTQKSNFIDQVEQLFHRENLIVYSSEERLKIILNYINLIYDSNYTFEKINSFPSPHISSDKLVHTFKILGAN